MVPTCWSEAEGEGRDGASWERINSKNKKQCLTAAESRRRAQPSSLGSPQQPPEYVSGRTPAPQTRGSRTSRRGSSRRVWRPPSAASPPAPAAGESKGPALQVFLRLLQTVGSWVGAMLAFKASCFGGLLSLVWECLVCASNPWLLRVLRFLPLGSPC